MFALIVQTILLIATAFILGCILGCLLRRMLGPATAEKPAIERPTPASVTTRATPPAPPKPVAVDAIAGSNANTGVAEEKPFEPQPAEPPTPAANVSQSADAEPVITPPVGDAAAPGEHDNLKRIKGIGPQNEARLNAVGVVTFRQIAAWSVDEQKTMGDLMAFPGRIERERWVEQAAQLADGQQTDFSRRVDTGSVTTSIGAAAESGLGSKPEALLLDQPEDGQADDLTQISGIGSALVMKLGRLGVFHFRQIAAMSTDELRWLDTALGFPGRAERENWQGAARILADGGTPEGLAKDTKGEVLKPRGS